MNSRPYAGCLAFYGSRKPRRNWGSTAVAVIMLLALSALAGWLMSLVRHGAGVGMGISHGVTSGGMLLAAVPWQAGSVIGLLAFGSMVGIWLVVKKSRREEEGALERHTSPPVVVADDIEAELRWSVVDPDPGALQPDDLRRILWSVTECVCVTCDNVSKARLDLSVEDCGEKLEAAENDLRRVIKCLGDLMKHLNAADEVAGARHMTLNQEEGNC